MSLDERSSFSPRKALAAATKGIVFYSTPHFGSSIAALGWKLRHISGALPASAVHHLAPGPHLVALNQRLRGLVESGKVQVRRYGMC